MIVRDVELMRRLYRSGESEYLIDGEICRLRDVQDLLMDAGLGIKAYAVIEQGKIGQILSARPTDRRQLIEEAAGVTKYKSRRRAAELKLEAAQQNLTRVDDIVFEVEKQRGTLKRQAAKARRYKRLRDELRRWEKVQYAQRYRRLGEAIESARAKLADARMRETAAAAHLAEVEATLERMRLELTEADSHATASRENAHAREIEIGRLQQQIALDRQQVETLGSAAADIGAEVAALEERREPARLEVEARRESVARATAQRDGAAETCGAEESAYADLQRNIEGLEADVEASRSEVFAAVNAATALRHALEHASSARGRIADELAKLDVEDNDLRIEGDRVAQESSAARESFERARAAIEALTIERAARESELTGARAERDAGPPSAAFGRTIWHRSRPSGLPRRARRRAGALRRRGEVAARRRRRNPSARIGGRSSRRRASLRAGRRGVHRRPPAARRRRDARRGRRGPRVRKGAAGRPRWLSGDEGKPAARPTPATPGGVRRLSQIVRVTGPAAAAIEAELSSTWVADSFEAARWAATQVPGPVATVAGDVFRGGNLVEGGQRAESLGILSTKREIKELREKTDVEALEVDRLRQAGAAIAVTIAAAESAIASLQLELHRQEKAAVGFELQIGGRERRGGTAVAEGEPDCDRTAHRRRRASGAGVETRRGPGVNLPYRDRSALGRRAVEPGTAAALRGPRGHAGSVASDGGSEGGARRPRRARLRAEC